LEGVKTMAITAISADTSYQHSTAQRYDDWFSTKTLATPNVIDHSWLASRMPTQVAYAVGSLPAPGGFPKFPCPKGVIVQVGSPTSSGPYYISLIDNNLFS